MLTRIDIAPIPNIEAIPHFWRLGMVRYCRMKKGRMNTVKISLYDHGASNHWFSVVPAISVVMVKAQFVPQVIQEFHTEQEPGTLDQFSDMGKHQKMSRQKVTSVPAHK
jgi:hypothetical protein